LREEQSKMPVWGEKKKDKKSLSLAEIQAEEAKLAAARAAEQERAFALANQARAATWGSAGASKPISFLEIQQQEQLRFFSW
jgi:hypothetical protein